MIVDYWKRPHTLTQWRPTWRQRRSGRSSWWYVLPSKWYWWARRVCEERKEIFGYVTYWFQRFRLRRVFKHVDVLLRMFGVMLTYLFCLSSFSLQLGTYLTISTYIHTYIHTEIRHGTVLYFYFLLFILIPLLPLPDCLAPLHPFLGCLLLCRLVK